MIWKFSLSFRFFFCKHIFSFNSNVLELCVDAVLCCEGWGANYAIWSIYCRGRKYAGSNPSTTWCVLISVFIPTTLFIVHLVSLLFKNLLSTNEFIWHLKTDIVLYLCEKDHIEGGMIFQLLEDLTEMSTMRNCKDIFGYIESKQDILGKVNTFLSSFYFWMIDASPEYQF